MVRSMRPYTHTRTCRWTKAKKNTHTKYDENIGRHLKKKKIGTPKVFQRLYVFHLYAQRNHSLGRNVGRSLLRANSAKIMWDASR
jgi:hypothetical protein